MTFIKKNNIRSKKALGQNFLKSTAIVGRIAKAGNIKEGDIVLEIGPGKGILTKAILSLGATVVAVEKDFELIPFLKEKFAPEIATRKLHLIEGDILDLSASEIFSSISSHFKPQTPNYKLIANIPYYITGAILRKFLEEKNKPTEMVVLVQKEVARRIVANDKKESILSISVKAFGIPKYIETVKRTMFTPAPNVDSAILLIENISNDSFEKNNINEENFFEIVKMGFSRKRKMLKGNLKKISLVPEILNLYGEKRAENLNLEDWKKLSKSRNYLLG